MKALLAFGGVLLALPLALFLILKFAVMFGDDAHPWLRDEAYQATLEAALRRYDGQAPGSALTARDFTQLDRRPAAWTYTPCALSPAELDAAPSACSAVPGPWDTHAPPECRGAPCVRLAVTPQTWADAGARAAIVAALRDPATLCRLARDHALNGRASARAAGCESGRLERVHIVLALVPRRTRPCVSTPVRVAAGRAWSLRCTPAPAQRVRIT